MRKYLMLIVTTLFFSNSYANLNFGEPFDSNCRPALVKAPYYPSEKEKVQTDLLNGIWIHQLAEDKMVSDMKNIYEFEEPGLLKQTTVFDNGHTEMNKHRWRIDEIDGVAFLIIYDRTLEEEIYYGVEQNCEGIILTNIVNYETSFLAFSREIKEVEREAIHLLVVGQWEYKAMLFDPALYYNDQELRGDFINYEFDRDGNFIRIMGDRNHKVEERGFWEISKDGKFLKLKFSKSDSPHDIYTTQYVHLKQLDGRQMKVEHKLTTVADFESKFTFGKQVFSLVKMIHSF